MPTISLSVFISILYHLTFNGLLSSDVVLETGTWSRGASRTKMKVLALVLKIWSRCLSWSWKKCWLHHCFSDCLSFN